MTYADGRPEFSIKEVFACSAGIVIPLCAALALVFTSGGGILPFIPLICGITGSLALAVLLVLRRQYIHTRREHRLFIPLPILPRKWKGKTPGGASGFVPLVLALCLLAVPAIFRISGEGSRLIPKPHEVSGISGFSRENLRQLWASGRDNSLPDFSDYLCHRAFQQGFFYGYSGEFPLPDTKITLPRYREEEGVIKRTEDTLLTFDEIWYKKELEKAEKPGIGNLLLRQGVSKISLETAWRIQVDASWTLRYADIAALGLLPFLVITAGLILSSAPVMKNLKVRRNHQEA
jgi:hypothetical protein